MINMKLIQSNPLPPKVDFLFSLRAGDKFTLDGLGVSEPSGLNFGRNFWTAQNGSTIHAQKYWCKHSNCPEVLCLNGKRVTCQWTKERNPVWSNLGILSFFLPVFVILIWREQSLSKSQGAVSCQSDRVDSQTPPKKMLSVSNNFSRPFWVIWRGWPKQITHRQHGQKTHVRQFIGEDKFTFGSFWSFWICLGQALCLSKEFIHFKFLCLWGQKFQIFGVTKFCTLLYKLGDVSESTNIWWSVFLMLYIAWVLDWRCCFFHFEIFVHVLGSKFGYKFERECLKMDIHRRFSVSFLYQVPKIWAHLDVYWKEKKNLNYLKLILSAFRLPCISVAPQIVTVSIELFFFAIEQELFLMSESHFTVREKKRQALWLKSYVWKTSRRTNSDLDWSWAHSSCRVQEPITRSEISFQSCGKRREDVFFRPLLVRDISWVSWPSILLSLRTLWLLLVLIMNM